MSSGTQQRVEPEVAVEQSVSQQELTPAAAQEIQRHFNSGWDEFKKNTPDFSKIEHAIRVIGTLGVLGSELDSLQGTLMNPGKYYEPGEQEKGAIESMRREIRKCTDELRSAIQQAESVIESDRVLYGAFEKQIKAAKNILSACERV